MAEIKCSKCGSIIPEGEQFCSNCGKSVLLVNGVIDNNTEVKEEARKQLTKKQKMTLLISLVSVIILSIIIPIAAIQAKKTADLNKMFKVENGVLIDFDETIAMNYWMYDITIPEGITTIAPYAFSHSLYLRSIEIPDGVNSIGELAFEHCSSLESIKIPASVTSIGGGAFYNCSSLESVTISKGVTSIGERAFFSCSSLTNIEIPDSVTSIGKSSFSRCDNLTSIVIPDSVASIGAYVFSRCDNLKIYCQVASEPSGWYSYWNDSNRPVYWAGEWEYNSNSNPVPLE